MQLGLLDEKAITASTMARSALSAYFTPEGILHGAAQNNKGGEALQRSGYRVMSQMATGLAAQLEAAIDRTSMTNQANFL
ncbi:hypothetical protein D3C86_1757020 [compost metagenome]